MALFECGGGKSMNSMQILMHTYQTNEADVGLPKELIENFRYVKLATTSSEFPTPTNLASVVVVGDGSDAKPIGTLTSTGSPIDLSSANYENFVSFRCRNSQANFYNTVLEFYN